MSASAVLSQTSIASSSATSASSASVDDVCKLLYVPAAGEPVTIVSGMSILVILRVMCRLPAHTSAVTADRAGAVLDALFGVVKDRLIDAVLDKELEKNIANTLVGGCKAVQQYNPQVADWMKSTGLSMGGVPPSVHQRVDGTLPGPVAKKEQPRALGEHGARMGVVQHAAPRLQPQLKAQAKPQATARVIQKAGADDKPRAAARSGRKRLVDSSSSSSSSDSDRDSSSSDEDDDDDQPATKKQKRSFASSTTRYNKKMVSKLEKRLKEYVDEEVDGELTEVRASLENTVHDQVEEALAEMVEEGVERYLDEHLKGLVKKLVKKAMKD